MTTGSATIATILDNMIAAWNTTIAALGEYPSFDELTASEDGVDDFTLTADTKGKPFTVSITTNSALGTIAAASTTTANSGPNDWDTAANWSSNDTPDTGDDVYIDQGDDEILYGLDQNTVDLQSITIGAGFTGKIGLPEVNAGGYAEYRQQALKVGISGGTATVIIGNGAGTGSGRIRLDLDGATVTVRQYTSGAAEDEGLAATQITGTGASSVVEVFGGSLDVSMRGGESATVATLRVTDGAVVRTGPGVTLTTISQIDGTIEINSAATTINQNGGELSIFGAGAYTTINCGGTVNYGSSGTITTLNVASSGSFDCSADNRGRTITNIDLWAGATFNDPAGTVTDTNGYDLNECGIQQVTINIGKNFTITKTAI